MSKRGKVLQFVQELKYDIDKKKEYVKFRGAVISRIKEGRMKLENESFNPTHAFNSTDQINHLVGITRDISILLDSLAETEDTIKDIDFCTTMKLESFLSDFVIKFEVPARLDQSLEKTQKESAVLVPFYSDESRFTEITPEDLKVIAFLKDKFNVRNFNTVEFINKSEYYAD